MTRRAEPRPRAAALGRGLGVLPALFGLAALLVGPVAPAQEAVAQTGVAQESAGIPLRWDYLPLVGYIGDDLWFSLRVDAASAGAWTVSADGVPVASHCGADGSSVDVGIPIPPGNPPRSVLFH